jgi:toxin FitB
MMFVLNTSGLSAIMRSSRPVPEVAAWDSAQPENLLFTASVC